MCTQNSECKNTCNNCGFLLRRKSNYGGADSSNIYCDKDSTSKLIELSVKDGEIIKSPHWCPIMEEKGVMDKIKNNIPLTNGEKRTLLMRHKPVISWDDIKQDEIYHIPPLLGEKRKDVLVTWKGKYSLTMKDLTKSYHSVETIYPSTLTSRFLIKHKIKNIEIKEKK